MQIGDIRFHASKKGQQKRRELSKQSYNVQSAYQPISGMAVEFLEQGAQNMRPQLRQWCRRRFHVNTDEHDVHEAHSSSGTQRTTPAEIDWLSGWVTDWLTGWLRLTILMYLNCSILLYVCVHFSKLFPTRKSVKFNIFTVFICAYEMADCI